MRKIQLGQILHENGLDMGEYINEVADDQIKFYDDGSPNYLRPDVERWIRTHSGIEEKVILDGKNETQRT